MTDMVERVARAIANEGEVSFERAPGWYRKLARAAIEAMREPTEAMLDGARDWSLKKYGKGVGNDDAAACWQAMIDAALGETD